MFCSVLLPTSIRRWPHHGRTFSIYLCLLSFCLTLPRRVLSTSRPCVAFLAFVHLALLLALSLSPGNSLVSSRCDHSMLASLLCHVIPTKRRSYRGHRYCDVTSLCITEETMIPSTPAIQCALVRLSITRYSTALLNSLQLCILDGPRSQTCAFIHYQP